MKRDESLPDGSIAVGQTADRFIMVEKARLDAVMRMLVDSGDMTPMAVRQIKRSQRAMTERDEVARISRIAAWAGWFICPYGIPVGLAIGGPMTSRIWAGSAMFILGWYLAGVMALAYGLNFGRGRGGSTGHD